MTIERFSNADDADRDARSLAERLQEALIMQNAEEFAAGVDQLKRAAEQGKDTSDAWKAIFSGLKGLANFHETELRAWGDEDPSFKAAMRELITIVAEVFDLEVDLEDDGTAGDSSPGL
jgi:hypothetical protein